MNDRDIIIAVARSVYWGYVKDTTGTPGKWSELNEEDRKVWLSAAKRALRKVNELRPPEADSTASG